MPRPGTCPNRLLTLSLVLLGFTLPTQGAGTESGDSGPWTFSFYFENDLFVDTDQNYTNGTKFTWISPDLSHFRDAGTLPDWAYRLVQRLPFIDEEGIQRNVAFSLGQNIYTPQDTQTTALIRDDRPYVAWLYFGAAFHNKTEHWLDTMEISLGVIGPLALGEETQNFVHRTRNIPTAKGWENQLHNEPAINLIWERKFRQALFGSEGGFGMDLLAHVGASLGNVYTYANTGGGARFGYNLPKDFGASLIRLAGDANAPASRQDLRVEKARGLGWHFFAGVDGRAIARDITLDGNTWKDSHSVDKKNWVADVSGGFAFVWGGWKLSYAHVYRTKTFDLGSSHEFGSINISVSY